MSVQPGWYADPAEPSTQRYWDGEGWIGKPLPVDATPPSGPPPEEPEPEPEPPAVEMPPGVPFLPGVPIPPGVPFPPPAPSQGDPGVRPGPGEGQPQDRGQQGQDRQRPDDASSDIPSSAPPTFAAPGGPSARYPWPYPLPYGPRPLPRPHGLPLAPLGARLVARLIDIGVVFLLNVAVNGWFVWQYFREMAPLVNEILRRWLAGNESAEGLPQPERADALFVTILLIAAALWFAYEVPALANTGQTFGKRVMGVKVVALAADSKLGFGRAFRRWNTLGMPVFLWYCCGIGLLFQLIDCVSPLFDQPLRQALHDKRAQTVTVLAPRHPRRPAAMPPSAHPDVSAPAERGAAAERPGPGEGSVDEHDQHLGGTP